MAGRGSQAVRTQNTRQLGKHHFFSTYESFSYPRLPPFGVRNENSKLQSFLYMDYMNSKAVAGELVFA